MATPLPNRCTYCRRDLIDPKRDKSGRRANLSTTRDHIMPKCKGGRRTVLCCRQCNSLKGDLAPELWAEFMAARPKWWRKFKTAADVRTEISAIVAARRRIKTIRTRLKRCPFTVQPPPLCRGLAA